MSAAVPEALFGTDGMRGRAGTFPLDRPTVSALGYHLAEVLTARSASAPEVVLGGDTRESTPEIAAWMIAGLRAGGARCIWTGVLPTPGIAWFARHRGAAAGVSISASHNPASDNGIKLLGGDGFKWPASAEAALEARLLRAGRPAAPTIRSGTEEAALPEADAGAARVYLAALAATLEPGQPLAGLRMVLDCANGAASPWAADLFSELGAEVTVLAAAPNGRNINLACGSTHPEPMARRTADLGAALGASFDGDADRVVVADETGVVHDGDALLYLWATTLQRGGGLRPAAVVATSMSNLGLERALQRAGVRVVRCDVGDRAVVEAMRREGIVLGGEQSGHMIHLGFSTTGDGMLTALQIAAIVARAGRPLSELLAGLERFPQLLRNVKVPEKRDLAGLPHVREASRTVERRLAGEGRLVLRYSGTEPLARIMLEGPDRAAIEAMADELEAALRADLG